MKILKCLLIIVTAPVILVLTLFVWLCTGLIYISGLVLPKLLGQHQSRPALERYHLYRERTVHCGESQAPRKKLQQMAGRSGQALPSGAAAGDD